MRWEAWVLVVTYTIGGVANIAAIGTPRKPISPEMATGMLVTTGIATWLVLRLANIA